MVFKSFNQIVRHSLERFVQSQDGNIAVIFGIAVIPLISFVGAAIDCINGENLSGLKPMKVTNMFRSR